MFPLAEFGGWLYDWSEDLLRDSDPYGCFVWRDEPGPNLVCVNDLVWIQWLLGKLEPTTAQRDSVVEIINAFQLPEGGCYENPPFNPHGWQHATWRALASLNMLGGSPRYPLTFLEPLRDVETCRRWVREYTSSVIARGHHRYALAPFVASLGISEEWEQVFFSEIQSHQNPQTGFWGPGVGGFSPTFLISVLHLAFGQEVPYATRVVDTVLAREHSEGFYTDRSPNFYDMDAAFMLNVFSKTNGYRRDEALAALSRMDATLSDMWETRRQQVFDHHPHQTLAICGICSVLQDALPDRVVDEHRWPFVYAEAQFLRVPGS